MPKGGKTLRLPGLRTPKKQEIEALLNSGALLRKVERRLGISKSALHRHFMRHYNFSGEYYALWSWSKRLPDLYVKEVIPSINIEKSPRPIDEMEIWWYIIIAIGSEELSWRMEKRASCLKD